MAQKTDHMRAVALSMFNRLDATDLPHKNLEAVLFLVKEITIDFRKPRDQRKRFHVTELDQPLMMSRMTVSAACVLACAIPRSRTIVQVPLYMLVQSIPRITYFVGTQKIKVQHSGTHPIVFQLSNGSEIWLVTEQTFVHPITSAVVSYLEPAAWTGDLVGFLLVSAYDTDTVAQEKERVLQLSNVYAHYVGSFAKSAFVYKDPRYEESVIPKLLDGFYEREPTQA